MIRCVSQLCAMLLFIASSVTLAENLNPQSFKPTKPTIQRALRTWTDSSGKRAVVAALLDVKDGKLLMERADGRTFTTAPDHLSVADRAHAIHLSAERVNQDADVLIGFVTSIMDGDTIQVRTIAEENVTVRLDGIDAPEKGQDFGNVAKDFLGDLIHEKTVRVEVRERDRYQRHLADVYLDDIWLNIELARNGLAWHYTKYNKDERLADAETEAKESKRGLWSRSDYIAPWDYRNGVRDSLKVAVPVMQTPSNATQVPSIRETDTKVFVTETGTKYHSDGCRHLKKSRIEIPLSRAVSAYEPCKVCNPPTK